MICYPQDCGILVQQMAWSQFKMSKSFIDLLNCHRNSSFNFLPDSNRSLGPWLSRTQTQGSSQGQCSPYSCKQKFHIRTSSIANFTSEMYPRKPAAVVWSLSTYYHRKCTCSSMHNGSWPADDDEELDEEQRVWSSAGLVLSWQVESAVPQLCAEEHQYIFREQRHIGAPFLQPANRKTN